MISVSQSGENDLPLPKSIDEKKEKEKEQSTISTSLIGPDLITTKRNVIFQIP